MSGTPKTDPRNHRPRDWDKAVSGAYLILTGSTQGDAAEAVGVHRDTFNRWANSDWWHEALGEAATRWLSGLEAKARKVLAENLDATLSLKILERRLPDLAPPTLNTRVIGDPGQPVTFRIVYDGDGDSE